MSCPFLNCKSPQQFPILGTQPSTVLELKICFTRICLIVTHPLARTRTHTFSTRTLAAPTSQLHSRNFVKLLQIADTSRCVTSSSRTCSGSLSPIHIPAVESEFPPPLCDNHVEALAPPPTEVEEEQERTASSVRLTDPPPVQLAGLDPPLPLHPRLSLLSDNLLPTTPTPSQLICHLHSSLQDNSIEPKEPIPKVWNLSVLFSPCPCSRLLPLGLSSRMSGFFCLIVVL